MMLQKEQILSHFDWCQVNVLPKYQSLKISVSYLSFNWSKKSQIFNLLNNIKKTNIFVR